MHRKVPVLFLWFSVLAASDRCHAPRRIAVNNAWRPL
jgi:hypothetical protein